MAEALAGGAAALAARMRTYRRLGVPAMLLAVSAIALAACGGGSTPQVASLGKGSGGGGGDRGSASSGRSAPRPATGDPTRLMDDWATCMRRHGDAGQADPTITANKLIDIDWNPAIPGGYNGTNKGGQGNSGPGQYCRAYLNAAQTALQGGQQPKPPDQAEVEKFSECMRANGIPDFPDPTANGLQISIQAGSDLDPSNPTFQHASKACSRKTGVPGFNVGTPPPGTIELNGAGPGFSAGDAGG